MIDKLLRASALPGRATFTVANIGRHESQLARWNTRWMKSSVAVVSARGEIDATNARALTEYTLAELRHCRALILDVTRLEFFGAAGISALQTISERCADAGMSWALVPSATITRLLEICDLESSLPVVDTVDAALARLRHLHPMPTIGGRTRSSV